MAAGRQALSEGNYQSAAEELQIARTIQQREPKLVPPPESRELMQLDQQGRLLADLLTESLEEVLRRLNGLQDRERQALFARRYQGKAIVFFSEVRRDATDQYHLGYRLFDGRREARLRLQDLELLQRLPLQEPQLLLFGARLAAVQHTERDGWVISLEPDSGVLLTNPGAAAACCFEPHDADQLQMVLQRQAAWIAELR